MKTVEMLKIGNIEDLEKILSENRSIDAEDATFYELQRREVALRHLHLRFHKERPLTRKELGELLALSSNQKVKDSVSHTFDVLEKEEILAKKELALKEAQEELLKIKEKIKKTESVIAKEDERARKEQESLLKQFEEMSRSNQPSSATPVTHSMPLAAKKEEETPEMDVWVGRSVTDDEWERIADAILDAATGGSMRSGETVTTTKGVSVYRTKDGVKIKGTTNPPNIKEMVHLAKVAANAIGSNALKVDMANTQQTAEAILEVTKEPSSKVPFVPAKKLKELREDTSEIAKKAVETYDRVHSARNAHRATRPR